MKELESYDVDQTDTVLLEEETSETYSQYKDFASLNAWKKAREVKLFFYKRILPKLPEEEKYDLGRQIRRAAISTTANIAEGYGRYHYKEGVQFYRISRGSEYELKDHLISCYDLEYIDKKLFDEGLQLIEDAKRTLSGFINYILKEKSKQ